MIALDEQNPKHRGFSRLAIAQRDIGEAQGAVRLIGEHSATEGSALYERLVSAAVVAYARPFIATRQYPGIPRKFHRFENPGYQTFHDELIVFRNRFIAHCDASEVKASIMPEGTWFRRADGALFTVARHGTGVSTRWFRAAGLRAFDELYAFQLERLGLEITFLSNQLFPPKA